MADAWPNMILLFPTKKKIAPTSTCTLIIFIKPLLTILLNNPFTYFRLVCK